MPTVHVGDVDLYYEAHGEGTPLLLINGLGSSVEMWSPFWKRLAEHYGVILFDNRGVGRSSTTGAPLSVRLMADDAAGLLEAIGVPQAHVFGASMGGMIAQELVLGYPAKVRALVLNVTTCGGRHMVPPKPEVMAQMAQMGNPPPGTSIVEILWSIVDTPEYLAAHRDELAREAAAIRYPTSPEMFRRQAEAVMKFNVYDRLPEIRVPTLVMAGTRDVLMPPGNAEILASRIPGASLRVMEGAPHALTREREGEAVRAIVEFLSSVDRASGRPLPRMP
jgi:pimeloyl-ACP methyl ester carboxylesterase